MACMPRGAPSVPSMPLPSPSCGFSRSHSIRAHHPSKLSDGQIPRVIGQVCAGEGIAPREEPAPEIGPCTRLRCGLLQTGLQLVQERRPLAVSDHLELGSDGGVYELPPAP